MSVGLQRPPRRMPHPYAIARYWLTQEHRFPENYGFWIGLGEPYCFGCGWLPDVEDGLKSKSWTMANSYLDRAHLADRFFDGLDDVQNLVMLCRDCHKEMPPFLDGAEALAWVRGRENWVDRMQRRIQPYADAIGERFRTTDPDELVDEFLRWEAERKAVRKMATARPRNVESPRRPIRGLPNTQSTITMNQLPDQEHHPSPSTNLTSGGSGADST